MRQFFALFLASALVISASASALNSTLVVLADIQDFFDGFADGLNYTQLAPDVLTCRNSAKGVVPSAQYLFNAVKSKDATNVATAIEYLGMNISHAVRYCAASVNDVHNLFLSIKDEVKNLNQSVMMAHLFSNFLAINQDVAALKTDIETQDFLGLGATVADLFKVLVYGTQHIPNTRAVRMLGESKAINGLLDAYTAIQAFFAAANTNISHTDIQAFVNASVAIVAEFPVLANAIKTHNLTAFFRVGQSVFAKAENTTNAFITLEHDIVAAVQAVAARVENKDNLIRALTAMVQNFPITIMNVGNIFTAAKAQDYALVGKSAAALYNQFLGGLAH